MDSFNNCRLKTKIKYMEAGYWWGIVVIVIGLTTSIYIIQKRIKTGEK
jgi:hypothetical protein